jgi:hypothetical protein
MDYARNVPNAVNIKKTVVRRPILTRKSSTIHTQANIEILQRYVMDNHVKSSLHESRIDGKE